MSKFFKGAKTFIDMLVDTHGFPDDMVVAQTVSTAAGPAYPDPGQ